MSRSPIEGVSIAKNNKVCLLYDQPWNWSVEFDGSRIKSPAEVTDIAKQLSLKGKSGVKSNPLKIRTYIIPHEFLLESIVKYKKCYSRGIIIDSLESLRIVPLC